MAKHLNRSENKVNTTFCLDQDLSIEELKAKLAFNQLLFRTIIDNMPSLIYAKDMEARKIIANKADCLNAGFSDVNEIIGKSDFDMFPKHIAEKFYQDDCLVLKEGKSIIDREELVIKPDGEERWIVTSKIPFKDEQGEIIGLIGFAHDITVEKRLEEENKIAAQMIKEQQDAVETMMVELSAIPEKISDFVTGIAYISKQTKMLAINAAIEAARVGEHGRGFEIVAREVGELSDRSSKATEQVWEAIEEVNSLIQEILLLWNQVRQKD